jgi:hypothetical protein
MHFWMKRYYYSLSFNSTDNDFETDTLSPWTYSNPQSAISAVAVGN